MDLEALRTWLVEHVHDIAACMDYEPTLDTDEELARTLGHWFGSTRWAASGHRFVHLGIDGTGGQFAAWIRPNAPAPYPVVLFGSEGGRGVLASSPLRWAQILAHAPGIATSISLPARSWGILSTRSVPRVETHTGAR
jgi:hypothetical protein